MDSTTTSRIGPEQPLPYASDFTSTEQYVNSLLDFVGTNDFLKTLCGGVHILDFFTRTPSLYSEVLPEEWRAFFARYDIMNILDLLLRDDLPDISRTRTGNGIEETKWNGEHFPPQSLLEYISDVRKRLLLREPNKSQCSRNRAMKPTQKLARHVSVGMTVKKVHEVGLFASYVDTLSTSLRDSGIGNITHLVDFGSGQNYLGRALASVPYEYNIVAIESKEANAERAKEFDVMAKLTKKQKVMRNKKAFRAGFATSPAGIIPASPPAGFPTPPPDQDADEMTSPDVTQQKSPSVELPISGHGKVQYLKHRIQDGDLRDVIEKIPQPAEKRLMVMSLHSCGNLVHHGLRSLISNPEVRAVAMVGCCYNLITERLGPASYKLPELRPTTRDHPRLRETGEACDPNGFPMSSRLCNYYHNDDREHDQQVKGVRLNITARMMAVQAPANWAQADSENFFTRHFYRALLQRIFLDRGVVGPPTPQCVGGSPAGHSSGGTPIIIGSLRKSCYVSFLSYVRGALEKLVQDPEMGEVFASRMGDISDAEILGYEEEFKDRKKELSIIWSLMAFSAGVIEATIVVDRWLWLSEQAEVAEAWVEPVFDYRLSPRNMVVVGIKKGDFGPV